MAIKFLTDVHIDPAIVDQLRGRGVDVLTAVEDGSRELKDDDLLDRAGVLGRVVFTHDIRFKAMAEDWPRVGRAFGGLVFGNHRGGSIGQSVADLELIAFATESDEWTNRIDPLPY